MSVCAKFQLSSWSRSGLKVLGGGVKCSGVGWLRPILVFSFSLSQDEQLDQSITFLIQCCHPGIYICVCVCVCVFVCVCVSLRVG